MTKNDAFVFMPRKKKSIKPRAFGYLFNANFEGWQIVFASPLYYTIISDSYVRRSCACRSRDLHNYGPHRRAHGRGGRT